MPEKKSKLDEKLPQIAAKGHITKSEGGTNPSAKEKMRALKDRRTRATKERRYVTKSGERTYFQGQALAKLSAGPQWVTGNGDDPKEATMNACVNAYRKECEEREAATQSLQERLEAEQRTLLPPAPKTLREMQADYIEFCTRRRREDVTISKYLDHERYFNALQPDPDLPPMGEWTAEEIVAREDELQIAHDDALHRGDKPNTVRNRWTYLSSVLNRAVRKRWIESNPVSLLDLASRKRRGRLKIDLDGAASLMRAAEGNEPMRAALILGLCYGLRRQEICGVTSDDLAGGKLTVNRQLKRVKYKGPYGPGAEEPPKNADYTETKDGWVLSLGKLKAGESDVPYDLTPEIEATFYAALDTAKPTVIWDTIDRKWRTVWFVVNAPQGKATEGQRLRDRFVALCAKMGVRAVLHDLRALFASSSVAQGLDVSVTSRLLRHESVRTTEAYLRGIGDVVSRASGTVAERNQRALGLGKRED